jgi:valyl-tRNA synthetase
LTATGADISLVAYPVGRKEAIDLRLEQEFDLLFTVIRTIRNLRAEADIKPSIKANIVLQSHNHEERTALERAASYIRDAGKVDSLEVVAAKVADNRSIAGVAATVQVILPLTGVVDLAAFKAKLEKKLAKLVKESESAQGRLKNPNFVDRALPEVVQAARDSLVEVEKQMAILADRIASL